MMDLVHQEVVINVDSQAYNTVNGIKRVIEIVAGVRNINAGAFLNSTRKQLHISSEKLSDRPEGSVVLTVIFHPEPVKYQK